MTDNVLRTLPDAFLFMKVGQHAGESFEDILERKRRELEKAGKIFWGYGGNTMHPKRVQPFSKLQVQKKGGIYLLMQTIDSHADPDIVPATEYSIDGVVWRPIPEGIIVRGSRFALVLDEILPGDLDIPAYSCSVGIGPSRGRPAGEYIQGRVDKACLVRDSSRLSTETEDKVLQVQYAAKLQDPFAVFVR